ncbi:uncharacterized protein LOC144885183 isoform X2 [Branchiostoma floridae x Branchiostoma japonicum]
MVGTHVRIVVLVWAAVTTHLLVSAVEAASPTPALTSTGPPSTRSPTTPATVDPRDIEQCTVTITQCAAPAWKAIQELPTRPREEDLRRLCQLFPQLDRCVRDASRTRQCNATGTDQYALYKADPRTKPPEECAKYTSVAARGRLCVDVLLSALLTAIVMAKWE